MMLKKVVVLSLLTGQCFVQASLADKFDEFTSPTTQKHYTQKFGFNSSITPTQQWSSIFNRAMQNGFVSSKECCRAFVHTAQSPQALLGLGAAVGTIATTYAGLKLTKHAVLTLAHLLMLRGSCFSHFGNTILYGIGTIICFVPTSKAWEIIWQSAKN